MLELVTIWRSGASVDRVQTMRWMWDNDEDRRSSIVKGCLNEWQYKDYNEITLKRLLETLDGVHLDQIVT